MAVNGMLQVCYCFSGQGKMRIAAQKGLSLVKHRIKSITDVTQHTLRVKAITLFRAFVGATNSQATY
jgi:hypothetical protein